MITPVLFQKMPEVLSDKPQAENPIFPSKLRKPQADFHSCGACLLNCVLFIFCVLFTKIATLRVTKIIFSVSSGGEKSYTPHFLIFFFLLLPRLNQGWAQKGDKRLSISRDFLNSPVGAREVGVHAADRRGPETAAMLWGRWLFSATVRLWATGLQMKQGEEGCSLYRFKAPIALLGMSAAVVRQRKKSSNG